MHSFMHIKIVMLCSILLFCGCQKDSPALQGHSGVSLSPRQLWYGSNPAQNFYLSVPNAVQDAPIIILVHGGGWVRGAAPAFLGSDMYRFFLEHGYAIVDMNYRLADTYPYPAQLDDIDSLLQYLSIHAGEYAMNAKRICLFGQSAGAHLSMLYAYSRNTQQQIKMVMEAYGPADLCDSTVQTDHLRIDLTTFLQNQTYSAQPQLWYEASPINYIKHAVPTIIFQGTADTTVYPIQAERLKDSLAAYTIPYQINWWPGFNHAWYDALWDNSKWNTLQFIMSYL